MRINIKIKVTEMTEIIEDSTKLFNVGQCNYVSIKNIFCHGGQDPWKDCEVNSRPTWMPSLNSPSITIKLKFALLVGYKRIMELCLTINV